VLNAEEQPAFETGVLLFGRGAERPALLETADGGALQVEPIGSLEARWQRKLARFLDRGSFTRYLGREAKSPRPVLVILSDAPLAVLEARGRIVPELAARLSPREVVMPGLAERREDVPALVSWLATRAGARFELGPSAIGLLMRADLARHVSDLRHLVEALAATGAQGTLGAVDLDPFLALPRSGPEAADGRSAERAWILETLRRHAFNRTAAAREMGIARKTLYNRMRRHGL
jgi:DNA-binding NtrC family response regulator